MSIKTNTYDATSIGKQQQKEFMPKKKQSGEKEAQDLFYRLESLLVEGKSPVESKEEIEKALDQTQNLMKGMGSRDHLDSGISNTLEDISELLFSARQMGRNKDFADRLQNLALDTQKALRTGHAVDISDTNKEATAFINCWRPLFYLLMNSRQFREVISDTIRIAWRVVYVYEDFNISIDHTRPKSREEAVADRITKAMIKDIEAKGATEMTDEEWNYLHKDIQKVWLILAREPIFRQGVERIFMLLDIFQKSIDLNLPTGILSEGVHSRREVNEEVFSSFSGRETLEEFKYQLRHLIIKFNQNDSLRGYLRELKKFILKPRSEENIFSEEFKEKSKELACSGRSALKQWKDEINLKPFLKSAYDMIENIQNEEFLQLLRHHAGIVKSDLSYVDSEGIVQVDTNLLSKLQTAILPVLSDTLKTISLPRIQSDNDNREYLLDKLLLCCRDIKPENIRFYLESEVTLSDIQMEGTRNYFVIEIEQLFTELKDVDFFYRKKTFPAQTDSGLVTFRGNKGAKLVITYNVAQDTEYRITRITDGFVSFHISDMDIEFDKSTMKEDVWASRLTKIFQTEVIKQIEYHVETNLNGFMIKLGDLLMNTIASSNRPCLSAIDAARQAAKSARIFDKRPENAIE
jgi:hypothetical protein